MLVKVRKGYVFFRNGNGLPVKEGNTIDISEDEYKNQSWKVENVVVSKPLKVEKVQEVVKEAEEVVEEKPIRFPNIKKVVNNRMIKETSTTVIKGDDNGE